MALEIERKFLAINGYLPVLQDGQYIIQGYLSEKPSIRYRFLDDLVVITVKDYHDDGSRFEFETINPRASDEERSALKRLSLVTPIEKIRYKVPFEGLTWEIDVFQGVNRGLVTVDVELPEIGYHIFFPSWVNSQEEITHDPEYSNINLGRRPFSTW